MNKAQPNTKTDEDPDFELQQFDDNDTNTAINRSELLFPSSNEASNHTTPPTESIITLPSNQEIIALKKKKRKKFTKSKSGCLACKERKIKCDQHVPICLNCEKKGIECPYLFLTPFQIHVIEEYQVKRRNRIQTTISENDTAATPEFQYRIAATVDLNTEPLHLPDSTYQASEIENILLSQTNDSNFVFNFVNHTTEEYVPLRTHSRFVSSKYVPQVKEIPLYSNARKSTRSFSTDHSTITRAIDGIYGRQILLSKALYISDVETMMKLSTGSQMDYYIYLEFIHVTLISQLFNKLLRKSFILLAMDYYKNTILKQRVVSSANCKEKLAISCVCENLSVISIDHITRMIKNDYLPSFSNFFRGARNLFLGSFLILDDCLGYHFKNGLRYDMSFEEGNKAVNLVGIFSTGIYSIIMARSHEEVLFTSTNMFCSYLVTVFRRIISKNYNIKIFDQFKTVVDKHSNDFINDINMENLRLFCKKHLPLLNANVHEGSLLGFNNGYMIRIYNSFKSIIPFDLANLTNGDTELFEGRETDVIIFLFYSTFARILDALMPGRNIICGSFSGSEMDIYNIGSTDKLMKLFSYIKSKKMKLTAIYLIRTGMFIKWQWMYNKVYLSKLSLINLLENEKEMSINERCLRLKAFKENGAVDEIQVKDFLLEKGQFFKKWNYPNHLGRKHKRTDRVSTNKISNYFNHDEDALIDDFVKTNTGFFSMDYDTRVDEMADSMIKRTEFVDENQIKILWKLITYIRINNL